MSYTITVREHEMGEQPFAESHADDLATALNQATLYVTKYIFEEPDLDHWRIANPADFDLAFVALYTTRTVDPDGPSEYEVDYIIEVRANEEAGA